MIPLEELLDKFSDYPKLLKIPKASLPNVILNSNLKHLKQNHYTESGEMISNSNKLANQGLIKKYGYNNLPARARVEN
jgi:DNA polymerase-3 subunit alpha/error-prone DNA polymerase